MSLTFAPSKTLTERRVVRDNVWLCRSGVDEEIELMAHSPHALNYEVLESEKAKTDERDDLLGRLNVFTLTIATVVMAFFPCPLAALLSQQHPDEARPAAR